MGLIPNWWSLVILRAFLGVFEAGCKSSNSSDTEFVLLNAQVWPGTVYLIGAWYKQYEAAKRITFCYMTGVLASGLSPIVSDLLLPYHRSLLTHYHSSHMLYL